MLNFEQQTWYNKNDYDNQDKRIPITAFHLNRIEEGVNHSVVGVNKMFNYWWRKRKVIDSGTTKYGGSGYITLYLWTTISETSVFYYSNSVSVKVDNTTHKGYVELDNPSSIKLSYSNVDDEYDILKNKYFIIGSTSGQEVYYMPENGRSYEMSDKESTPSYGCQFVGTYKVACFLTYGDIEYVESDKIDAYPNGWSSDDDALYEFLGVPFENSRESLRAMYGYYCGDGASSRLINTPQKPQCVLWSPGESEQAIVAESFSAGGKAPFIHITNEGFTISHLTLNTSGTLYNYIIFY